MLMCFGVSMDNILDSHQSYSLVDAPYGDVLPALIGGARALFGLVAWEQGDRRRSAEIANALNANRNATDFPLAAPQTAIVIHEVAPDRVLIEDTFNEEMAKTLSCLLPAAPVLGTESWFEGVSREGHGIAVFQDGLAIRRVGVSRGVEKRGWHWEDEGAITPWEDPLTYAAPQIGARLSRSDIHQVARNFGVDIDAGLAGAGRGGAVILLSHYHPETPERLTTAHMDISKRAVVAGHGDPLHLQPFDADAVAGILEQMRQHH